MHINDYLLFFFGERASPQVWSQVIYPSQSTTLSTSLQAYDSYAY